MLLGDLLALWFPTVLFTVRLLSWSERREQEPSQASCFCRPRREVSFVLAFLRVDPGACPVPSRWTCGRLSCGHEPHTWVCGASFPPQSPWGFCKGKLRPSGSRDGWREMAPHDDSEWIGLRAGRTPQCVVGQGGHSVHLCVPGTWESRFRGASVPSERW